ncbi:hypothetical protein [Ochrobactrum sp. Marseille-Q0166]|uniref:hypothetical protein n=1 Tax=Ochrobactrum sp. Marseille-Q0166 TaxID=2761105 RepID=UPI001655CBED|nr:hypothetical protein [Ochrobactrum sp. Marseille-Q0166]MBC8718412.1 hypothetical protein [Ochrobactrum sp. Marseille-Q0166]
MNTLSWLLYLADVAGSAKPMFGFIAFMVGLMGGAGVVVLWVISAIEDIEKLPATIVTVIWVLITIPSLALAILIPSKDTIYLITASQAGEVVVKSDEAKEIMSGLRDIIKEQIKKNLP